MVPLGRCLGRSGSRLLSLAPLSPLFLLQPQLWVCEVGGGGGGGGLVEGGECVSECMRGLQLGLCVYSLYILGQRTPL